MTPLAAMIARHEGKRNRPYVDTVGKLTIGVGHNLDDKPISDAAIAQILADDIADCRRDAATFPWFVGLDPARQDVVLDMLFNLGLKRFTGFKNTIAAIESGRYVVAADLMLDSLWAKQVGRRSQELSAMMRTGQYQEM